MIPRHLLDSLAGCVLLRGENVLDVGSGAGLPGMVLAIAAPHLKFVLADRSERRMRFCDQMIRELGLENVQTWVGDVASDRPAAMLFDTVVARGVATAPVVWDMVSAVLNRPGRVVVYASTLALEDAEQAPHVVPAELQQDVEVSQHEYAIPQLDTVHTLVCMDRR